MSARVLYISYDGLLEPLGQSQVWQYVRQLGRRHRMHLLTFEKQQDWNDLPRRERLQREVASAGIGWTALRYHKRPTALATSWDIAAGTAAAMNVIRKERLTIVHARSYVAAVIALALQKWVNTRFIFDMRGFWADERVDGNLWPRDSVLYRSAKRFERQFLSSADAIVSLTEAGVRALPGLGSPKPGALIQVIPTCTNLQLFKPPATRRDPKHPFTLGYLGTVGTWYLFEPVLDVFVFLKSLLPNARLLIVNRGEHEAIRVACASRRIRDGVTLIEAHYSDVAESLGVMDAAVFFIRQVFSKLASAPTKLGELLGSGVPCLSNSGVGDVEEVLTGDRVGVVVNDFSATALAAGTHSLMALAAEPGIGERCRASAEQHFSLDVGVRAYERLYEQLSPN